MDGNYMEKQINKDSKQWNPDMSKGLQDMLNKALDYQSVKSEPEFKIEVEEAVGNDVDLQQPLNADAVFEIIKSGNGYSYNCLICYDQFMSPTDLENHLIIHSDNGDLISDVPTINKGSTILNTGSINKILVSETSVNKSSNPDSPINISKIPVYESSTFLCSICSYIASSQNDLNKHVIVHAVKSSSTLNAIPINTDVINYDFKSLYQCKSCKFSTFSKDKFFKHTKTHTNEVVINKSVPKVQSKFKCIACFKCFNTANQLKSHIKYHTANTEYRCLTCDFVTKRKSTLSRHVTNHVNERLAKRVTEDEVQLLIQQFERSIILNISNDVQVSFLKYDAIKNIYKCSKCVYKNIIKSKVLSHYTTNHASDEIIRCGECDKTFSSEIILASHMRHHQLETTEYKCTYCTFTTRRKIMLEFHIKLHQKQKLKAQVQSGVFRSGLNNDDSCGAHVPESIVEVQSGSDIIPFIDTEASSEIQNFKFFTVIKGNKVCAVLDEEVEEIVPDAQEENVDPLQFLNFVDVSQSLSPEKVHCNSTNYKSPDLSKGTGNKFLAPSVIPRSSEGKPLMENLVQNITDDKCEPTALPNVSQRQLFDKLSADTSVHNFSSDTSKLSTSVSNPQNQVVKKVKCLKCSYSALIEDDLQKHMQDIHKNNSDESSADEADRSELTNEHVDSVDDTPFKCNLCSKEFRKAQYLNQHAKYHVQNNANVSKNIVISSSSSDDDDEFECSKCKYTTNTKENLQSHTTNVHKAKAVACGICKKILANKGAWISHLRVHKPLELSVQNYTNLTSATNKKQSSNNAHAVPCNICHKLFRTKDDLMHHCRTIHKLPLSNDLSKRSTSTKKQMSPKELSTLVTNSGNGTNNALLRFLLTENILRAPTNSNKNFKGSSFLNKTNKSAVLTNEPILIDSSDDDDINKKQASKNDNLFQLQCVKFLVDVANGKAVLVTDSQNGNNEKGDKDNTLMKNCEMPIVDITDDNDTYSNTNKTIDSSISSALQNNTQVKSNFTCTVCNIPFVNLNALQEHMKIHKEGSVNINVQAVLQGHLGEKVTVLSRNPVILNNPENISKQTNNTDSFSQDGTDTGATGTESFEHVTTNNTILQSDKGRDESSIKSHVPTVEPLNIYSNSLTDIDPDDTIRNETAVTSKSPLLINTVCQENSETAHFSSDSGTNLDSSLQIHGVNNCAEQVSCDQSDETLQVVVSHETSDNLFVMKPLVDTDESMVVTVITDSVREENIIEQESGNVTIASETSNLTPNCDSNSQISNENDAANFYICDKCGDTLKNQNELKSHDCTSNKEPVQQTPVTQSNCVGNTGVAKTFICAICEKTLNSDRFEIHMKKHFDDFLEQSRKNMQLQKIVEGALCKTVSVADGNESENLERKSLCENVVLDGDAMPEVPRMSNLSDETGVDSEANALLNNVTTFVNLLTADRKNNDETNNSIAVNNTDLTTTESYKGESGTIELNQEASSNVSQETQSVAEASGSAVVVCKGIPLMNSVICDTATENNKDVLDNSIIHKSDAIENSDIQIISDTDDKTCDVELDKNDQTKSNISVKEDTSKALFPFSCDKCIYRCYTFTTLTMHQRHNHSTYICDICNRKLMYLHSLQAHYACYHKDATLHLCKPCNFFTTKKERFDDHIESHDVEVIDDSGSAQKSGVGDLGALAQSVCNTPEINKKSQTYTTALAPLADGEEYQCPKCDLSFTTFKGLSIHERLTHARQPERFCKVCKGTFNSLRALRIHMENHGDVLKCLNCNYGTRHKKTFEAHIKKHSEKGVKHEIQTAPDKESVEACASKRKRGASMKKNQPEIEKKDQGEKHGNYCNCLQCNYKKKHKKRLQAYIQNHSTLQVKEETQTAGNENVGREPRTRSQKASAKETKRETINNSKIKQEKDCGLSQDVLEIIDDNIKQEKDGELSQEVLEFIDDQSDTFACKKCQFTTSSNYYLLAHIKDIHCNEKHTCVTCNNKFPTAGALRLHMKTHFFNCIVCRYFTKYRDKLDKHMVEYHLNKHEIRSANNRIPSNIQAIDTESIEELIAPSVVYKSLIATTCLTRRSKRICNSISQQQHRSKNLRSKHIIEKSLNSTRKGRLEQKSKIVIKNNCKIVAKRGSKKKITISNNLFGNSPKRSMRDIVPAVDKGSLEDLTLHSSTTENHSTSSMLDSEEQSLLNCLDDLIVPSKIIKTDISHKDRKIGICNDAVQRKRVQKRRLNKSHWGRARHKCTLCNFKTYSKILLNAHLLLHTGKLTRLCTSCNYKTENKLNMIRHLRIYNGSQRLLCMLCKYSSRFKYKIKLHIVAHTRERPHRCKLCDYSTSSKRLLYFHLYTHLIIRKKYKCTFCTYRCKQKRTLVNHMKASACAIMKQ